ncbi:MAG: SDR family NAD(P)-dependent oxidoreductase [Candidatus Deferrimicrobiaceae bacterium]
MGKVTLVTGATSGLGKSMALLLASKGYEVYAGARTPVDGEALVAEAQERGILLKVVPLDVTDDGTVRAAVSRVARESGRLDNLVNNAGYGFLGTVEEATDAEILRQFDVNVFGVGRMCRAAIPFMRARRSGVIVNISAWLGPKSPYAALTAKLIPVVAKKINEGPNPVAVAEAVQRVIENSGSPIRTPVGVEAETFVPMAKKLSDEAFEAKVKETFGL